MPDMILSDNLIPIVVGIAGHRDLQTQDLGALRERVREVLAGIRRRHPHSPLIVLSSLAEGADCLAAKEALECGAVLVAPLPFDEREYGRDFKPGPARQEYQRLLELTQHRFAVSRGTFRTKAARDAGYARCGAYIATHCHVLLALWDGAHKDTVGGTSQVVSYKLKGTPGGLSGRPGPTVKSDVGPVWQITSPRQGDPMAKIRTGELVRHAPQAGHGGKAADPLALLDQIESFNRKALAGGGRLAAWVGSEFRRSAGLWGELDANLSRILGRHVLAGELSTRYQKKWHSVLLATFLLGVSAFGFLEFYEYFYFTLLHHQPGSILFLVGYIFILLLAYGVFALAAWRKYHNKHLDYRALAEGLRVQFAWAAAGMPDDVSDHYLTKHCGELGWIRHAIRMGNIANPGVTGKSRLSDPARAKKVLELWVRDQRDYYQRAWRRNERKVRRQELVTNGCFGLAVLIAVATIFAHHALAERALAHSLLGYAITISFALAAAASGFAEKMVFGEQAKQYNRMAHQFDDAAEALERAIAAGDLRTAEELLREVGKEALSENSDWVMLHRSRPLEVPRGG
ncbi:MAG: hypothetical protein QME74_06905 [Candidatus Edwardsbacteria bacterium]|nr:hypothetical protein [Candidatus Edwardsbacteria bacterium]